MPRLLLILTCVSLLGCGKDSPSQPTLPGSLAVTMDSKCSQFPFALTGATVVIDGVNVGTVTPAGPAVIKPLQLGSHSVSGTSIPSRLTWGPTTRVLSTSQPDFTETFFCL